MMYNNEEYSVFLLCSSSIFLNNTTFPKLHVSALRFADMHFDGSDRKC
jgi:hypothetical protein